MAITTYTSLVEGIQKWCARSDTTFTNRIPDFVEMAEQRIYFGADLEDKGPIYSPPLRNDTLETSATLTFVAGSATLPATFLGARKLFRSSDELGLTYMPPERFAVRAAYADGGQPIYFTVEAGVVKVHPSYDGEMTLQYWRKFPALTGEAPTNALLTAHSPIYLTAALFEAFTFTQDADLALGHVARLRAMIDGLNKTSAGARVSGASLRITPRRAIP